MNLVFSHPPSIPEYWYLHYPLCRHHCSYCDFNVYRAEGQPSDFNERWLEALLRHWDRLGFQQLEAALPLKALYLGGGTPSLLSPQSLEELLTQMKERGIEVRPTTEVTIEANPETLTEAKVCAWGSLGINRISLGVQSFQDVQLRRLERLATRTHLDSSLEWISKHFQNFSVDLMVGLPDQTFELLDRDIDEVLRWSPPHISAYTLTLTEDHKWNRLPAMKARMRDEESVERFYLHIIQRLRGAGYHHYEVSNFAKPGFESVHNRNYWNTQSGYFGLGPGAHGYIQNVRYECVRNPDEWMKSDTGVGAFEVLNPEQQELERFYMALRTRRPLPKAAYPAPALSALQQAGFVRDAVDAEQFILTDRGWLLMESVAGCLLS